MKIAVNTRFLLPGKLEGIGWFTCEVVRRLVARHPDDEFLFLFDRPYDAAFLFGPNVQPLVVPPPARHPFLWYWWFQRSLPRIFKRWQPHVFFSPDGHLSLTEGVPTLLVVHDIAHVHFPRQVPRLVRRYYDYYIPRFLVRANQIATVSEFSRRDIVSHYGTPVDKITVCGNGGREGFRPLSAAEKMAVRQEYADGHPYFFYVGAIHPRKNVDNLIRAFDCFKERTGAPVKLLIGGAFGWQTEAVRKTIAVARYRNDIVTLGYLPEKELPRLLAAALALTYVSFFEGFGIPLLEAMHAEVPILTANTSSLPEVAGEAALLVDPTSISDIAGSMERLFAEPALRHRLTEAGRARKSHYSWEKTTDSIEQTLWGLANNPES